MTFEEFLKVIAEISKYLAGGTIGGVLGYLLKTQIDHRLAIARNYETLRVTEFNKAAAVFRAEFVNEIFMLRKNIASGNEFVNRIITNETIIRHEKARIIFGPFIDTPDLGGFNEAWEKYKNCEYDYFSQAQTYNPANITNRKEFSQFYLDHIESLLKFAKPKG
ncbi:hypothetical protein A2G06_09280 [Geobacter anodireducens]|nr:hypothetical protein A2G06_09280 [Geobacter anodireducens]